MAGKKGKSGRKKAASTKLKVRISISPEIRELYRQRYGNLSRGIEKLAVEHLQEKGNNG